MFARCDAQGPITTRFYVIEDDFSQAPCCSIDHIEFDTDKPSLTGRKTHHTCK